MFDWNLWKLRHVKVEQNYSRSGNNLRIFFMFILSSAEPQVKLTWWNQEWLSVMANITCLTALSGNQVYPMSVAGTDTGTVRLAKYLCCHVLTENHLPILSRFSPTMISSNFNVCTILDFCGYLLSRRCNINIVGVRGTSEERASPVISPWQLISNFHVHLEVDLSYD